MEIQSVFCIEDIYEVGYQKENNSDFSAKENYAMVARKHQGDEKGNTWCKFAKISTYKMPTWVTGISITVLDEPVTFPKESNSELICDVGTVIVQRKHSGDENGKTVYYLGKINVETEGKEARSFRIVNVESEEEVVTVKESEGTYAATNNPKFMVGRKHVGDENANTVYTFTKYALSYNE